ncbi:MAG: T9SS type A sorting domain-containing protein [Flavobacteriales bacterium]|nr:T9SS type A sorting domain-containing protein [Flavobacteriales bacterium]
MQPGTDYVVEFYISLADYMESSIDRIGAYLSPEAVMLDTDSIIPLSPQVNANDFVSDVSSWTRIADTIQVTEECHFITIGNFFADDMTSTLPNPSASGAPGSYGAFYFLDDIRVEALTSLGVDEFVTERFSLYPSLVKDILTVELTEKSGIEVYDSQGQLILSQIMTIGRHYIDMSKYASGSYSVLFKGSDHVESKQIIKR